MHKTLLDISVSPKSSRSVIVLDESSNVKMYLNSPPVDGKANEECVRLLAKALGIPKSHLAITKGASGRKKRVAVTGLTLIEIIERLTRHIITDE